MHNSSGQLPSKHFKTWEKTRGSPYIHLAPSALHHSEECEIVREGFGGCQRPFAGHQTFPKRWAAGVPVREVVYEFCLFLG